ncbi:C-OmpA-like family protein CmpA [Legionella impletisoli]|uniref:Membrane protein n=1 Tax=Legionella impletisoli TaxID=343510 RepID=A0A917NF47_9GAMM|nr:C-OmpA-like family protein CmpA [Legionella impletisoli]GGI91854.1 membrane protein [Legionella impletisoli]
MPFWIDSRRLTCVALSTALLSGCLQPFNPPYNNFRDDHRKVKYTVAGAAWGATVGAIAGSIVSSAGVGAVIGGVTGSFAAYQLTRKPQVINELKRCDMQYIKYADIETLIVPTDTYFYFDSPRMNDLAFQGLNNIVRLLKFYPCTPIYVAGFTDDVGSREHKRKLTQARAEAMITFLWANGIQAYRLHPEGYEDKYPVGDNDLIRGSAFNRRLEIQWQSAPSTQAQRLACAMPPKRLPSKFGRTK